MVTGGEMSDRERQFLASFKTAVEAECNALALRCEANAPCEGPPSNGALHGLQEDEARHEKGSAEGYRDYPGESDVEAQ